MVPQCSTGVAVEKRKEIMERETTILSVIWHSPFVPTKRNAHTSGAQRVIKW